MFIKWFRAKYHGVPFDLPDFWPPTFTRMGLGKGEGVHVLTEAVGDGHNWKEYSDAPQIELASGDVIPLLLTRKRANAGHFKYRHYYKVITVREYTGKDHAFDPRVFDLRYSHTESGI